MQPNKLLVSLTVAVLICAGRLMAGDASTVPTKADIEKIVREYILQHPEVLLESVQSQRDREHVEAQARSKDAIAANRRELFDNAANRAAAAAMQVKYPQIIQQGVDNRMRQIQGEKPVKLLQPSSDEAVPQTEFPPL